ncbi:MAG: DUF1573 domain-containing protein [Chitinophagaceae bacterium]|nr:MAG: DUF1573 domain-containing protein [Chitinophagaceae bacterium]
MKKILFSLLAVTVSSFAFAQTKLAEVVQFKTETINLGKIKQNSPSTATFVVTNIGKTPLIIETASPTCGCTVGDYTKSPIAPGKTGTITATYDAKALGAVNKTMTVKFAGVDEVKSIHFTGEVLSDADYAKRLSPKSPATKKVSSVKKS